MDYDKSENDVSGMFSLWYLGMYLAAGNGTLQFLPTKAETSDTMVRVVSTEMPVVPGAIKYVAGSEQIYKAVVVEVEAKKKWPWSKKETYEEIQYERVDKQ